MDVSLLEVIDVLGLTAFGISGAYAAMEKRLDIFGVIILAFVTSIGGGTVRDLLLGNTPLFWLTDKHYGWIVLGSAIAAISFKNILRNFHKTLLVFDSLGLGLYTIVGLQIAERHGLSALACIAMGTITGCFGGILRDVLLNKIPIIFAKEVYASTCIVGGSAYYLMQYFKIEMKVIVVVCIILVTVMRLLAVRFNFQLPNLYGHSKRSSGI